MSFAREPLDAQVSLVVALTAKGARARRSIDLFRKQVQDRGELIVVDGSGVSERPSYLAAEDLYIQARPNSLAPELWARGLEKAGCPLVAFTTSEMSPSCDWLDQLVMAIHELGAGGVGGSIAPSDRLSTFDRAVYLHRFAVYQAHLPGFGKLDPPGDNAIYDRFALENVGAIGRQGFWEVEIHKELEDRGYRLLMNSAARLEFVGVLNASNFLARRLSHAKRFAQWRAEDWSALKRMKRIAAAPLVPLVLLLRGFRRIPKLNLVWTSALPALAMIAFVWALGEALGLAAFGRASNRNEKHVSAPFNRRARSTAMLERPRAPS